MDVASDLPDLIQALETLSGSESRTVVVSDSKAQLVAQLGVTGYSLSERLEDDSTLIATASRGDRQFFLSIVTSGNGSVASVTALGETDSAARRPLPVGSNEPHELSEPPAGLAPLLGLGTAIVSSAAYLELESPDPAEGLMKEARSVLGHSPSAADYDAQIATWAALVPFDDQLLALTVQTRPDGSSRLRLTVTGLGVQP